MDEQQITNSDSGTTPVVQAKTLQQEIKTESMVENEEELKKKMEAIFAMEGEEGKAKREKEEKEKQEMGMVNKLEEEKAVIKTKINEITKDKEDLELKWIDLSNKKGDLQKILDPILSAEMNIEKDVQAKNQEEHATEDTRIRQALEKERQAIEAERQKIEKEKWIIEDKMAEISTIMNENKVKFQGVLNEEYSLTDKVREIDEKVKSIKVV